MNKAENIVGIAAKLYECRRTLRTLRGDRYTPEIIGYMEGVRRHAVADGTDDMHACMKLAQEFQSRRLDMAAMWVMAAAVELMEPDELTPKIERVI